MSKRSKTPRTSRGARKFGPIQFLETAAKGRIVSSIERKQLIFAQGDPADAVFYIQKGKVKITVLSEQGKEAVVAVLGPDEFWVKDVWQDSRGAWRQRPP